MGALFAFVAFLAPRHSGRVLCPTHMSATYQQILDKGVLPKMVGLGFSTVHLENCMRPEVLLRNGDLWFGTSWDYRDQYLELNIGGLYWLRDVMPRVVVLGEYSDHCPAIKRLSTSSTNYLEEIAMIIVGSIEDVVRAPTKIHDSEARSTARLRALLLGKVTDSELKDYRA